MRTIKLFLLCLLTAAVCQTARAGMAVRLWYTATGNSVTNITTLPGFPNGAGFNPSIYYAYDDVIGGLDPALTYLTTALRDDTSYLNNYGTFIRGFIEAPADGSYRFFIYSDDNSEFWLSSNTSPANRVKVAENIGAVGRGNYSAKPAQRSALIPMVRGQKYYYEVYTKEGGGDDHFGVGWQLPDGTLNRPISSKYLIPFNQIFTGYNGESNSIQTVNAPTFSIPRYTGFNSAPTLGTVSGNPVSQQGVENGSITFEATVIGAQPMTMQWFRTTNNGTYVAIPGANLQHITVSNLAIAAHNNTQYQLRITNANGNATSAAATLTVVADTTAPTLVSANAYGRENGLTVVFSEPVSITALNTNNYYVTNTVTGLGVKVLAASFWGADQRAVNLVTEQFPVVQSLYSVVVRGVQDLALAPNTIVAGSSLDFNSVYRDNLVTLRYFEGITTGGAVANLTNATGFINNAPNRVETRNLFEGPTTYADNYGIQYIGYVIPPTNGNYTFYVSSDDQSVLWLSTDENPANKRAIASEPNNSGVRVWFNGNASRSTTNNGNYNAIAQAFSGLNISALNISPPIALQANTRYYIEYLTKEGGGGDNGAVAWQIPDGPVVANNSTPIEAAYMSTTNRGGIPISIVTQPVSATFADQANATFTVVAAGTAPAYQWYRGNLSSNVPVPDATGATLTTDPVGFPDAGSQFFVIVNNGFSAATSSVVTLSVIPDTVKPTLVRARSDAEFDLVTVSFSERLNEGTATNAANFTISGGLNVVSARLGQGRTNVILGISPLMNTGTVYTVTVSGVMDSSSSSNAIVAASTVNFTSWVESRGFAQVQTYLNIGGTAVTDLTGNGVYPDLQDTLSYITGSLNFPQTNPGIDNFGVRITGTITPQVFDFYKFLISSDDASVMYLGTDNRLSSIVRTEVASQTGANVAYANMPGTYTDQVMFAGVPRAFEVLMKEGGGGDYVRAAWVGGLTDPTTYNNNDLINALQPIPAVYLAVYADPVGANVGIVTQPVAAITTNEVFQITLSLVATGSITGVANPPISYIWQRKRTSDSDFIDFPDGNGNATFLTPRLQFPADNGARYRCLVSVPGKSVFSSETLVTVGQDTAAPVIVRSYGSANYTNATIAFNEPIDIAQLTGLTITSTNGDLTVSNPRVVNLTNLVLTTSLQATNVRYTVTLSGVRDIAFSPTTIAPNSTTSFTSWIIGRGGVTAQRYLNLGTATGAGGLDVLRNSSKFPNNADQQWMMNESRIPQSGGADLRTEGASPGIDGFGGRMYGYIIPPSNGTYILYFQTDDSSEFRLSTDADPANMVLTMRDTGCCQAPSDTAGLTLPISANNARVYRATNTLSGNQLYYFEAIYKEGGGGDLLRLVWKDRNNTAAPNATGYIPANNLASIINPDDSSITFNPNLTDVSVLENRNVTFNGTAIAKSFFTLPGPTTSDPVTYQWQSSTGNGVFTNISGQTGATLTRLLNSSHNGFQFRVIASVTIPVAMSATSAVSTVTISSDTARPILTRVGRDSYFTNLVLSFDELLAPNSVTNVLNYSITNAAGVSVPVISSRLRDGSNVVLVTGLQNTGATYTVTISPTNVISDLSLAGTNLFTGGTSRTYNTFVRADGYLQLEYFLNIGGGQDVATLTNSAGYRENNPGILRYTNIAHIAATAPNIDNFGAKFYGFFRAPTNGAYTFFIRGDDGVVAFLTTNGVRQPVAARNNSANQTYDSSNPLNNNTPAAPKVVVDLTAGEYYPLEAVLKEGGGGDTMEFAVTANGQVTPGTGGANTIPGAFLATWADPDGSTLNITGQPASLTRAVGATATFTVTATGTSQLPGATIRYQWSSNGVNIVNATNASHTTPALTLGANGAVYQVRVYHPEKAMMSSPATLTVGTAPAITAQITPSAVVTNVGSNVTFTVTATGSPTPTYQWRRNNTNVNGATLTLLTLNNVQFTNQGTYTVVISNALGSITSAPATLQVLVTPYSFAGSTKGGGGFGTTFATDSGRGYVVEFKDYLTNANWTLLTNVVGTGSPATISDPGATGPERYYRIRTTFP